MERVDEGTAVRLRRRLPHPDRIRKACDLTPGHALEIDPHAVARGEFAKFATSRVRSGSSPQTLSRFAPSSPAASSMQVRLEATKSASMVTNSMSYTRTPVAFSRCRIARMAWLPHPHGIS